ncbi:helix-turn-helix domain-containing protein [Actinoalloteichus hymeniacidonis]|uniref:DNA binding protein with helix-turn-helix domain n=1 Tax=Actinoalloteichus hymeniacidonis TaxID=340345 RepID=A0AAC9N0U5_9PSEU|nr:helix-turn-helix transcriptional regulator [Actinoalloteichus hymeniacidonis]AOS65969.1 DNA binding protein with helix-turn-helix domain [Actinoalloteichus hymeniacidonis]MBB5905931.1 transcriptional regulator with XRE-family HTH domain [Actinoalloteichus hymeniacidonis]
MPTVGTSRVRLLGSGLREAREQMSLRALATACGISAAQLSKFENGRKAPKPSQVSAILTALGVVDERRDALVAMAERSDEQEWLEVEAGPPPKTISRLIAFEREAVRAVDVACLVIPGWLQTPDYARGVLAAVRVPPAHIDSLALLRVGRAEVLTRDDPLDYVALIDETVLHRKVGSHQVMAKQLGHLLTMSDLPNVEIRILAGGQAHLGMEGPFLLLEFSKARPIVHLEHRRATVFLDRAEHVSDFTQVADILRAEAMSSEQSRELIAEQHARWENGDGSVLHQLA